MMTRHLLWKDGVAIKPLVTAILVGIVVINGMMALVASSFETNDYAALFLSIWVLMPNLVALGAPALLVGAEEESGTLGWLRTLPVRWQKVADSKFLVAIAAVAITWIASSLVLLLSMGADESFRSPYVTSMLSLSSICYLMFFSSLLLSCGFITAYLFRSPIAGLIAVVPLIAVVNMLALDAGRWILTGDIRDKGIAAASGNSSYLVVGMAGFAFLVLAWGVQRVLAWRRLTSPQTHRLKNFAERETGSAYRPPALVGTGRPNPMTALLWQHFRQMGPTGVALTLVMAAFWIASLLDLLSFRNQVSRFILNDISPGVLILGASWLGGLAFYGDNVRRRCAFFADRGISPTRIWWTRLLFPIACFLVQLAIGAFILLAITDHDHRSRGAFAAMSITLIVMFSFGQLVGQWMQRPVLTFLAAPAFTVVAGIILFPLYSFYPAYAWTAILVAPILLFASWRLAPRWLAGKVDFGYHGRVFAYTALAVALPIVAVISSRVWTTPELMPKWRMQMMAIALPDGSDHGSGFPVDYEGILPDAFNQDGFSNLFQNATTNEQLEMLQQELASDPIGDHVSLDDIDVAIRANSRDLRLQQATIAVLLKWDRNVREGVVAGRNTLWDLETVAEASEVRAVQMLERLTHNRAADPKIKEFIDSIPDREMRKRSRRIGLIAAWPYQHADWRHESTGDVWYGTGDVWYGKSFMRYQIAGSVARFPLERTRSDRFIDKLTRSLLAQLDQGLPDSADAKWRRDQLWSEARGPQHPGRGNSVMPIGKFWTNSHEQRVDRLKARHGAVTAEDRH